MSAEIISIEESKGVHQFVFQRVMRMIPDKDRDDKNLQRLLAFRLRIDGEGAVREYLMRRIREMIQCAYQGSLYEFLKNDNKSNGCMADQNGDGPPEIA
ncbi:MAG: hypothetical protein HKM93_10025 [Desulfobacteraceae bacterium]|nr:hypothetical protein [Desulfobacteraceae bacterium]